jgi:hypothetical protein
MSIQNDAKVRKSSKIKIKIDIEINIEIEKGVHNLFRTRSSTEVREREERDGPPGLRQLLSARSDDRRAAQMRYLDVVPVCSIAVATR